MERALGLGVQSTHLTPGVEGLLAACPASVSLAAEASSAATSTTYFRQLFLSSSTQPNPRMRPAHRAAMGSSLGSAS